MTSKLIAFIKTLGAMIAFLCIWAALFLIVDLNERYDLIWWALIAIVPLSVLAALVGTIRILVMKKR